MSQQRFSRDADPPAPTADVISGGPVLQISSKNHSQTNGSGEAPLPSQQNSTSEEPQDKMPSNSSSTLPTTAPTITSSPTQAGEMMKFSNLCGFLNSVVPSISNVNSVVYMTVRELVVSAGESVEVTLPRSEVELNAFVVPAPKPGTPTQPTRSITLFRLTEPRVNKPPVAVVSPKYQEISLPTSSTVIDGSQSTDDDKVVTWHWEEVKGPLREEKVSADTQILTLTGLVPGNYTFSLTVTDSDGAQNSTQAMLSVNKAMDYRPVANAGPNQVITLPRNSVTLNGNQSTDDHEPLAYEWSLSPESKGKVVEMQGVRTPILQLSAMQEGDYTFQLTVTDSAGQQDTARVTVIVQPENNKPPVADAGPEKELTLPVDRTTLDGSKSTDDQKISTYHWKQSGGPDGVKIENADSAIATVTGLQVGRYMFSLTVTDERELENTDVVTVIVREEKDMPPVARVQSSPAISLPVRTAFLDGSHSTDDKGGVSYTWTRDDSSPAAGDVLNNSDHQAVLFLTNLVEGKYSFTLTVTDSKGQSHTEKGSVEVKPDGWQRDLVELVLEVPISQVSHRQRDMLLRQVGVLLGVLDSDIIVREISAFNDTRLVFLVSGGPNRPPLSGHSVAVGLRNKLRKQKNDFLIFKARRVDTVICQLNCSSHGDCDSFTRTCVCHPFWMENFIKAQLWDQESNCEWSVLYVTIASFMIVVAFATVVWGMVCCCRRRKGKGRHKSKSRYKILDGEEQESLELHPPRAGNSFYNISLKNATQIREGECKDSNSNRSDLQSSKREDSET
uniref:PKD domain-containing protein n=1 Tax=Esox lucius TaxID=8010 RepID=A0A6Q2X2K4_ESOLU